MSVWYVPGEGVQMERVILVLLDVMGGVLGAAGEQVQWPVLCDVESEEQRGSHGDLLHAGPAEKEPGGDAELLTGERVSHGVSQGVLLSHGVSQSVLVSHGVSQGVLVSHGVSQGVLVSHGVSQRVLVSHGVSQGVLVSRGVSLVSLVSRGVVQCVTRDVTRELSGGLSRDV